MMKCGTEVDGERWPETSTPHRSGKDVDKEEETYVGA